MNSRAYMHEPQKNIFDGDDREENEVDQDLIRKKNLLQRIDRAKRADIQRAAGEDIGYLLGLTRLLYGDLLETEEAVRPVVDEELIAFMLSDLDQR